MNSFTRIPHSAGHRVLQLTKESKHLRELPSVAADTRRWLENLGENPAVWVGFHGRSGTRVVGKEV